jgi:hypothetical protein
MQRVRSEWEVVYLLGAMAKDAGFRLIMGSDAFPDALIEVTAGGEPIPIRAELEYRTSRFHHDRAGCDVVICWRADSRLGDTRIIELHPLFPDLDKENPELQIDHELRNPLLRDVFFSIQDWLYASLKLRPTGTGSTTSTTTVTFKDGQNSICSLQYCGSGAHEYLRFRWFKKGLSQLQRLDALCQRLPSILGLLTARSARVRYETATELHVDIYPQDSLRTSDMLSLIAAAFGL